MVRSFADTDLFDLVTNVPGRTFPHGMSVEIIRTAFYAKAMATVNDNGHREHVTSWLYAHPDWGRRYVFENRTCPEAAGGQLALDTHEDLALAHRIMARAGSAPAALGLREIFELATRDPAPSPWRGSAGPLLFVGYQAEGTPGRAIQRHGPRGGWVQLDGERIDIRAGIHTIGGYSAHADQSDLLGFIQGIPQAPKEIRLIHGDRDAREALKTEIETWAEANGHNVAVSLAA
jgi:hypothetical protein